MILAVAVLLAAAAAGVLLSLLVGHALRHLVKDRGSAPYWHAAQHRCQVSFAALLAAIAMYVSLPLTRLPPKQFSPFRHWLLVALIAATAWFVANKLHTVEEFIFDRYLREPQDPGARRARTQLQVVRRLTVALVVLVALGAMLATFGPVRKIGISLLASAGAVGLVLSIAAQPSLAGAVAGTQLAFSDSLRIDDVVVVEGEWGRIEELLLTHVVLRMWDGRRLILPTTYFTAKPYQNWTRYETQVLGTVELPLDYTVDLATVRSKAQSLIEASSLWDRKQWQLQMVDFTPQGVALLRITVSAPDGSSAWDLRCEIREGLVQFLRDEHPQWLPRRSSYQP